MFVNKDGQKKKYIFFSSTFAQITIYLVTIFLHLKQFSFYHDSFIKTKCQGALIFLALKKCL